jgi:hypothetical protein
LAEAERKKEHARWFRTASIYDVLHRSFFERASAPWLGPNSFAGFAGSQKRGG